MLFAPPSDINTEVFARIPDRFRYSGRSTRWVEIQKGGAATDCFLEGPSFDRDGNLYIVDVAFGRIFRVSPQGDVDLIAEYDGEPNGLKIHRDGRIFIADYRRGILLLDPASGQVSPFLERARVEAFKGVNDLFFAANGDLWFTDQGLTGLHDATGKLYRYSDGRLDTVVDGIPSPNGLVMNPQESTMYVAVTRANAVWRVPLLPDGGTFKVGVFVYTSGGLAGPDGMTMDEEGNLAVCHAGLGTVWLFSKLGEPLYRIRSCEGLMTSNAAYGVREGDRKRLYITESDSGTILIADLPVAGRTMYSHGT